MSLHQAARSGDLGVVERKLQHGADEDVDVNEKDQLGRTPLHLAAWSGHNAVVQALVNFKQTDIHASAQDDMNALHFAALKGHCSCAETLLQSGVKVNSKNRKGMNALLLAAQHGHKDMVELLLHCKANPLASNKKGQHPKNLCKDESIRKILENAEDAARQDKKKRKNETTAQVARPKHPTVEKSERGVTEAGQGLSRRKVSITYSDSE